MRGSVFKYREDGYVLLVTLITLSIVTVSLVSYSNRSLNNSMEVMNAQKRLAYKWASYSIKSCLHSAAKKLPELKEEPSIKFDITLSKNSYQVRVSDENAKVNLNAIYSRGNLPGLLQAYRTLGMPSSITHGMTRPLAKDEYSKEINSYTQLTGLSMLNSIGEISEPSKVFEFTTLWGNNTVNLYSAGNQTIRLALSGILDKHQLDKLIKLKSHGANLNQIINQLKLISRITSAVKSKMSVVSNTYSVWINHNNRNNLSVATTTHSEQEKTSIADRNFNTHAYFEWVDRYE